MQLKLWKNFSKKDNSTLLPGDPDATFDVFMKSNTSISSPVFLIDGIDLNYNYCYFNGRYYFINDIILGNNNIYEIHCTTDLLATYRSNILNTSALITYATVGDNRIIDNRIPVVTTPTVSTATAESIFTLAGNFVVSITGVNGVGLYAVDTREQLQGLMFDIDALYPKQTATTDIGKVAESIYILGKQLIGSAAIPDNIRDCKWMPLEITAGQAELIKVGVYASTCIGKPITQFTQSSITSINIPWQFSDWRNSSPYTEVCLYLPFVGVIGYSSNNLRNVSSLTINTTINVASGDISYQVSAGNLTLGTYGSNIAIPIPIGSSNINPMQMATSVIGGVASAVVGNVMGVASATLSALAPMNTTIGGTGGGAGAGLDLRPHCYTVCHNTTSAPGSYAAIEGIPYNAVDVISNHLGYVKCENASINIDGLATEKAAINGMLNGGIYVE